MWRTTVAQLALGLALCVASSAQEPLDLEALGLPKVDADALVAEVNRLADELRVEAERLIAEEGAEAAIARLRSEAKADPAVAFRRMNLAAVVGCVAGNAEGSLVQTRPAADSELVLALARHAMLIATGTEAARDRSRRELAWQARQADTFDRQLARFATILAALQQLAPNSIDVAASLGSIGVVCWNRGDLDAALGHHQRCLAIQERLAPDSLDLAYTLNNIGNVQRDRGDLDAALDCFDRALAICERGAPGSADCAMSYYNLGVLAERKGDLAEARRRYEQACDTIEAAREKSGSESEARAHFSAQYTYVYQHLIRVLLKLGDEAAAADVAERMRAQGLREQLLTRSLPADVSPEFVTRQVALDTRRNRLHNELRGIGGPVPDEARSAEITAELGRLRLEQEALTREIRAADPRYADLAYPVALTVREIAASLTPGTIVCSYVVGENATWLFMFGPGVELRAGEITVSAEQLEERVAAYLRSVRARENVDVMAAELGDLLLGPAGDALSSADRVLMLPDGPLWALPFQALTVGGEPLHDVVPVHYAPSGTVFVRERELREQTRRGERVLALGDPEFAAWSEGDDRAVYMPIRGGAFEAAQRSGERLSFTPIPFSGVEASLIDIAFRPDSDVHQGLMATEGRVRRDGPGRRVIHLATHGLIDPVSPMDSAVVLSPGPDEEGFKDDGFLKAWEVFALDLQGCDLVTLSACETAKGRVLSGEGVIGLTRAFLYAGAASVLCTQWSVADDSTAALMVRFYTHYRDGDAKDVALQKAMREIRTGKLDDGSPLELPDPLVWRAEWSHPYYWAPFILMGEWRQER